SMSAITTIVLLPLLVVVLTVTLELGSLRVAAGRVRSAADLAALVAVNDQDEAELARSGRLLPAVEAADVARAIFAAKLEPRAGETDWADRRAGPPEPAARKPRPAPAAPPEGISLVTDTYAGSAVIRTGDTTTYTTDTVHEITGSYARVLESVGTGGSSAYDG